MTTISYSPISRITIAYPDGSNPLDVSALLISLTTKNDLLAIDPITGLLGTTGTLVLTGEKPPDFPESLDSRKNPTRWARGNRVDVWVTIAGIEYKHPRGALRITQVPQPPRGEDLEIEVGCELVWLASKNLASIDTDEFTDPGLYEPTATRSQLISYLASRSAGTDLLDLSELTLSDYPISLLRVPGLEEGESRIGQLGAIAGAAGRVLWIDSQRRLQAREIDLDQDAIATYNAKDAIEFILRVGEVVSAEIIRTTSFTLELYQVSDPAIAQTVSSLASAQGYNPSEISTFSFTGSTSTNPTKLETVLRPAGLVLPDFFPNSPGLILASEDLNETLFSSSPTGDRLLEVQQTREPRGLTLPGDYPGDTSPVISKRQETRYYYQQDATKRIEKIVYEPARLVLTDAGLISDPAALTISEFESEEWQPFGQGYIKRYRRFSIKEGTTESSNTYSNQGGETPPAPERRQPDQYRKTATRTSQFRFSQVVGPTGDSRPKDYQLPSTVASQDQSDRLCALLGKLLYGQTLPASWVRPVALDHQIGDDYQPLRVYDWTEDGSTYRYLADGDTFELTTESFDWGCDAIYLGEKLESGAIAPPYRIVPEAKVKAIASTSIKVSVAYDMNLLVPVRAIASTSIKLTIGLHIEVDAIASTAITVTSGTVIAVEWAIAVSGENLMDSQVYLYYSETDLSGGDLAGYPRAVYVYGVDYDEATPIDATAFASTHGSGFYFVAPWISWLNDGNSFSSYYNMTVSSATPSGSAVINIPDELYRDSVNVGSTDASIGYVQVTNDECAIATTIVLDTIPS